MKRLWLRIKLFYNLIRITKNPYNTAVAIRINPILIQLGCVDQSIEAVKNFKPEKYLLSAIELDKLKNCPDGSLGKIYADHMISNGLDPNFFGALKVVDEKTKFLLRSRQTHDLWHVLTGYSTSPEDELGLQAFLFAQTRYPLASILIGGSILRLGLTNHPKLPVIFERITTGWLRGLEAKSFFAFDWEANWNTQLDEIRRQHNFVKIEPSKDDLSWPSS